MILYALKCAEGYIRFKEDGYTLVGLNKASVYEDIESIKALAQKARELPGLHGVEMTLIEREISL